MDVMGIQTKYSMNQSHSISLQGSSLLSHQFCRFWVLVQDNTQWSSKGHVSCLPEQSSFQSEGRTDPELSPPPPATNQHTDTHKHKGIVAWMMEGKRIKTNDQEKCLTSLFARRVNVSEKDRYREKTNGHVFLWTSVWVNVCAFLSRASWLQCCVLGLWSTGRQSHPDSNYCYLSFATLLLISLFLSLSLLVSPQTWIPSCVFIASLNIQKVLGFFFAQD